MTLKTFDQSSLVLLRSTPIPDASGTPLSLVRLEGGLLAFATSAGQIFLVGAAALPATHFLAEGATGAFAIDFALANPQTWPLRSHRLPPVGRHDTHASTTRCRRCRNRDPRRPTPRPRRDVAVDRRDLDRRAPARRRADDQGRHEAVWRSRLTRDADPTTAVVLRRRRAGLLRHLPAAREPRSRGRGRVRHVPVRVRASDHTQLYRPSDIAFHHLRGRHSAARASSSQARCSPASPSGAASGPRSSKASGITCW